MCVVRFLTLLLIIAGALNWGMWGFFQHDLIADYLGGNTTGWARLIYCVVGIAGIYGITFFFCKGIYVCHPKKEENVNKEDK
jgi:uncharacterized protein